MGKLNILIIGYYGSNNIGDEILLEATINLLNKVYESPKITAITYNVQDTINNRKIDGVSRNKFFQIAKAIKKADIIVGGGGSMLQNVTSNRSLIYYLTILQLAKAFSKKVVLLGNGIGPLKSKIAIRVTKYVLKSLDGIVLRDIDSYNMLKSFGLKNIYLGNDLVFTLDRDNSLKKTSKKILINLRKWTYNDSFLIHIIDFINHLVQLGFEVTLVPFQLGNDDILLKNINSKINSPNVHLLEDIEYESIIYEISTAEVFISMRLHGLIFSSICNTPFIGLSYDPKVTIFSKNQQQEYFEELDNVSAEMLINRFNSVYNNIEVYTNNLQKNTQNLLDKNHVHTMVLKTIIEK